MNSLHSHSRRWSSLLVAGSTSCATEAAFQYMHYSSGNFVSPLPKYCIPGWPKAVMGINVNTVITQCHQYYCSLRSCFIGFSPLLSMQNYCTSIITQHRCLMEILKTYEKTFAFSLMFPSEHNYIGRKQWVIHRLVMDIEQGR